MSQKYVAGIPFGMLSKPVAFEKITISASDPIHSFAFMLQHLLVTVAEDEGSRKYMFVDVQGRVKTLKTTLTRRGIANSYTERYIIYI